MVFWQRGTARSAAALSAQWPRTWITNSVWARWISLQRGGIMSVRQNIKVAIAGVGNCASALVQGVEYYRGRQGAALEGVMRPSIGGYRCSDIEFVAAFDIDRRKVGHALEEAIFAKPNCTRIFQGALPV